MLFFNMYFITLKFFKLHLSVDFTFYSCMSTHKVIRKYIDKLLLSIIKLLLRQY